MSTCALEAEIARFLRNTAPEVLCIRGAWGTGKTFVWERALERARNEDHLALKRYAGVSLFGINTLQELKDAILENTLPAELIGQRPNLESFGKLLEDGLTSGNLKKAGSFAEVLTRKFATPVGKLPVIKQFVEAAAPGLFLLARDQVVCIDDIERKGKGLDLGDVLGLVSLLKERRNCKIVLILNDNELGDQKRVLELYLEKVVDISLVFAPSPERSADIALNPQTEVGRHLRPTCIALGLTNIRVLRRIQRIATSVADHLQGRDPRVLREALKNLVVLAWMEYSPGDAPTPEFLAKHANRVARIFASGLGQPLVQTPEERRWEELLAAIDFGDLGELGGQLEAGIRNGFFDEPLLGELARKAEASLGQHDRNAAFQGAWRLYHDSLDDNHREFVEALASSIRDAVQQISPLNLDSSIRMLKELGEGDLAATLLSFYIDTRQDGASFFELRRGDPLNEVKDPDVRQAFADKAATFIDERTLGHVLVEITEGRAMAKNLGRLASATPTDLADALQGLRSEALRGALDACASLRDDRGGRAAAEVFEKALDIMAGRSPLNPRRLARFRSGRDGRHADDH